MSDQESGINPIVNPRAALGAWQIEPRSIDRVTAGVNNQTFRVEAAQGQYYLRFYSSEMTRDQIRYEHELLAWLDGQALPFRVPSPLATSSGETYPFVRPADGGDSAEDQKTVMALFAAIPGRHPQKENLHEVEGAGLALGRLDACLGSGHGMPVAGNFATYGELVQADAAVRDPIEMAAMLPGQASTSERVKAIIGRLLDLAPGLYGTLPVQVIHADFGVGNILFNDSEVSAILDFEFALPDLRALDLAGGLETFCFRQNSSMDQQAIAAFLRGYAQSVNLTAEEIEALPDLLRLRAAVVLVYWLGRRRPGKASQADVGEAVLTMVGLDDWLSASGGELVRLARESSQG